MSKVKVGNLILNSKSKDRHKVLVDLYYQRVIFLSRDKYKDPGVLSHNESLEQYLSWTRSGQSNIDVLERILTLESELADTKDKLNAYKKAVLQKDGLDRVVEKDSKREEFGKDWLTEMLKFDKEFLIAVMKSHVLKIRELEARDSAIMPRELTAENGAKAFFSHEFFQLRSEECRSCSGSGIDELGTCEPCEGSGELNFQDYVTWDTIKTIYKSFVDKMEVKPE